MVQVILLMTIKSKSTPMKYATLIQERNHQTHQTHQI